MKFMAQVNSVILDISDVWFFIVKLVSAKL